MITQPNQEAPMRASQIFKTTTRIIAFAGPKQSGKTTAASYLETEFGATILSFATPVKDAVKGMLGGHVPALYTQERKEENLPGREFSYRKACEFIGAGARAGLGDTVWVDAMRSMIGGMPGLIVIDDLRYENEAELIEKLGGVVIGIRRPLTWKDGNADSPIEQAAHDVVKNNTIAVIHNGASLLVDNAFVDDVLDIGRTLFLGAPALFPG